MNNKFSQTRSRLEARENYGLNTKLFDLLLSVKLN